QLGRCRGAQRHGNLLIYAHIFLQNDHDASSRISLLEPRPEGLRRQIRTDQHTFARKTMVMYQLYLIRGIDIPC
ncbi:MAG: hypothetical protein ACE5F3_07215, partial [Mariprofundaceae bacterium]